MYVNPQIGSFHLFSVIYSQFSPFLNSDNYTGNSISNVWIFVFIEVFCFLLVLLIMLDGGLSSFTLFTSWV